MPPEPEAAAGPLAELLTRDGVTDVLVNGAGRVWCDGEAGLRRVAVTGLDTEEQVRALAVRLAAAGGRRLDDASPWVDARLPSGVRLHAVLPALCRGGTHLSLRVPAAAGVDLDELGRRGSVSPGLAVVLREVVAARRGMLVTGATGAGKTTLLSALLQLAGPDERLVLVEDAAELAPRHPHVVALQARPGNVEGSGQVGLDVLVRQALRMRPDRLVVGECRGSEVRELLLAMGAGHAGAATLHAARPGDVPVRVVALAGAAGIDPANALLQLRTGVDVVVPVERGRDGRRRVLGVWGWGGAPDGAEAPVDLRRAPALVPLVDAEGRSLRSGRHALAAA